MAQALLWANAANDKYSELRRIAERKAEGAFEEFFDLLIMRLGRSTSLANLIAEHKEILAAAY